MAKAKDVKSDQKSKDKSSATAPAAKKPAPGAEKTADKPTGTASTSSTKKPPTSAAKPQKSGSSAGGSGGGSFGGAPLIDTSLAASNAARQLVAGINAKGNKQQSAHPESSLFKQMKSGLNKPTSATMNNLLDKTHGPSANKPGHGFQKQVGKNQTVGSDAARVSVPRRTAG